MKFKFSFSRKAKPKKPNLAIDIGTEAVKAFVFSDAEATDTQKKKTTKKGEEIKKGRKEINLHATSIGYFDKFSVFSSKDFEEELLKRNILKVIQELKNRVEFAEDNILLSLPADIFKARVVSQSFQRERAKEIINIKEVDKIHQEVSNEVKKKLAHNFTTNTGFSMEDFYFNDFKILETKVDGYTVPSIKGLSGKNIELEVLITSILKSSLEKINRIFKEINLRVKEVVHRAENITVLLPNNKTDAIYLDIGGRLTEAFLLKKGRLKGISEFEHGGAFFTEKISQALGIPLQRARVLKHDYSELAFSGETKKRIKEILIPEVNNWFISFKGNLKKLSRKLLPSNIFIFGGASLLPEISEILQKGDWSDFPFSIDSKVRIIYPEDLNILKAEKEYPRSPQLIPPLLLVL